MGNPIADSGMVVLLKQILTKLGVNLSSIIYNMNDSEVETLLSEIRDHIGQVASGQVIEFILPGNTGINQNGNYRIYLDTDGKLKTSTRVAGIWTVYEQI